MIRALGLAALGACLAAIAVRVLLARELRRIDALTDGHGFFV